MKKPFPALCGDCRHARIEKDSTWNNRCFHPIVVSKDAWALATNAPGGAPGGPGKYCRDERDRTSPFAACGRSAKLWEPRPESEERPK